MVFGFGKPTEQKGSTGVVSDVVKDTNTSNFAKDVLEASRKVPVLVDFWAPWCGPCKQLTPVLEKVVRGYKGKVQLVKINIDENQAIAAQLRIQSLPTVYAFRDGRPLDGFMGAQPESAVKAFVDRLLGDEATGRSLPSSNRPTRRSRPATCSRPPKCTLPCCKRMPRTPRRLPGLRGVISRPAM